MGFGHEWEWNKIPSDGQWDAICIDAQKLFDALPAKIMRGMFEDGFNPDTKMKRVNQANNKPYVIPAVAGFKNWKVANGNEIRISPEINDGKIGGCEQFVLTRGKNSSCKTQSTPYDLLVTGVLMACETNSPGSIQ